MSRPEPFAIKDCALVTLSVGRTAHNLRDLRDRIAEVPATCIWHHFYETLLRPMFDDPEYRNDFARWARRHLHDTTLAERLAIVDPMDFETVEHLRHHLVDLVDDRLAETTMVGTVTPGHEFHFLRSQVVTLDTGLRANSPEELGALIPRLPTGSIFFHFVEAIRRPPIGRDDFSAWMERWEPDYAVIHQRLAAIDIQYWSLSELRRHIAACFEDVRNGAVTR